MDNNEQEYDIECSCGQGLNWEWIKESFEPVSDIDKFREFMRNLLHGETLFDGVSEAYGVVCPKCEKRIVIAEVPEMCESDEDGYSAPAYLQVSFGDSDEENSQEER